MDEFVLLAGSTRLFHGFMLVMGIVLLIAAVALVRRRLLRPLVAIANGNIEVRFLFPRAATPYPIADVQSVTLVETCHITRAGWSTRSMLEIGLRSGSRAEPIEGDRNSLVALAERIRELASVQPTYEARSRELAQGACTTESPW